MQSNVSLLGMPAQCMHLSLQHIKPSSSTQAQTWFQLMTHVPLSKALGNCAVEKGITQLSWPDIPSKDQQSHFPWLRRSAWKPKAIDLRNIVQILILYIFGSPRPKIYLSHLFVVFTLKKTRIFPIHFPYNFDNHLKSLMLHTVKRDIFRDAYIQTVKKPPLFLGI